MRIRPLFFLALGLPGLAMANSCPQTMERLSVGNPEFIFYANLENDFATAGAFLSEMYLGYLQTAPQVPPIPVDFRALFNRLGLGNLNSVAMVSEASPKGGFLNQSLFVFDGAPGGVFLIAGSGNQPFGILREAPADADLIAEFNFNGPALYQIIRALVIDFMGPLGEGIIDGQMSQPLNEQGLTLQDLVNQSRTRIQIAMRPNYDMLGVPGFVAMLQGNGIIRIAGMGNLLPTLDPFLQQAGFVRDGDRRKGVFPIPQAGFISLILEALPDSNDLLISLTDDSRDWFFSQEGGRDPSPALAKALAGLPTEGLSFWYVHERVGELQIDRMDQAIPAENPAAPLLGKLKGFLKKYTGPQAGVALLEEDAYHVLSWQPVSYKTHLALAGLGVPVGLAAAVAAEEARKAQEADGQAEQTGEAEPEPSPAE
ncbi:MAG: hypothetical protein ACP5I4_05040 [Oceanipulchritudo sp.]